MDKVKFQPTLSLGHVLQAIVILVAGIVFAVRLEARIDVQEIRLDTVEHRLERSELRTERALNKIGRNVDAIKDTLQKSQFP